LPEESAGFHGIGSTGAGRRDDQVAHYRRIRGAGLQAGSVGVHADVPPKFEQKRSNMQRRTALQLIAIAAAAPLKAQHDGHTPISVAAQTAASAAAGPRFFSPAQNALVDRLAEMILPADDHSPGAHEAQVSAFIDGLLADSAANEQKAWTDGLAAVEARAKELFSKAFLECSSGEQDQIMAEMAANEQNPASALQRFFAKIKMQTISGYYTSRIGLLEDLQYKGIVPIPEYEPCNHTEHGE
jgi:hypothetical protein